MNHFEVLKNKSFRPILTTSLLDLFGESALAIILLIVLQRITNTVVSLSFLFFITMVSTALFTPFYGVLLDRLNKAKLNFACRVGMILSFIPIVFYSYFDIPNTVPYYVTAFIFYSFFYLIIPTNESLLKEILNESEYLKGTSLLQMAWQVGILSAGIVGGAIAEFFGIFQAILLCMSIYVLSSLIFLPFAIKYKPVSKQIIQGQIKENIIKVYFSNFVSGLNYLKKDASLLYFSIIAGAAFPFFRAVNTLITPFNYNVLQGNAFSLGLIDGACGIGGLLSSWFLILYVNKENSMKQLTLSIALLISSMILFLLSTKVLMAFFIYILIGFFAGSFKVISKTVVLEIAKEEYIGRTLSAITFTSIIFAMIIVFIVGIIADYSIYFAYIALAAMLLIPLVLSHLSGKYQSSKKCVPIIE